MREKNLKSDEKPQTKHTEVYKHFKIKCNNKRIHQMKRQKYLAGKLFDIDLVIQILSNEFS